MLRPDLPALAAASDLDRFLQWDLVSVTPWGAPAVASVGARLVPTQKLIWTSTTVGYAAKVRNVRQQPRVALLRALPGRPAVMLRGEASLVAGDGTANLTRLFNLMGGAGGSRPFFERTTENPLWRRLYQEYWRRILIRVRVVEWWTETPTGWEQIRLGVWRRPPGQPPAAPAPRAGPRPNRPGLESRGRQMLRDGMPAVLALADQGGAPWAVPVETRVGRRGELMVRHRCGLPGGEAQRSSLAVRVVDDSFELARMIGWIGALRSGVGWREFEPRSVYGFTKPPGVVPDLAAGLAAVAMSARHRQPAEVSRPRIAEAAERRAGSVPDPVSLGRGVWTAVEELFVCVNASGPWYAGAATLTRDPARRAQLTYLAQRAELERDWAQSLLVRGRRQVGPLALARGALAVRPRSTDPLREAHRLERVLERWRRELRRSLPAELRSGLAPRLTRDAEIAAGADFGRRLGEAAWSLAGSTAAALDRLMISGRP